MSRRCEICETTFEISDAEAQLCTKFEIPLPRLCPEERLRHRLVFRNEFTLYRRKCSLTGQDILSNFDEDTAFPVYNNDVWWSDSWDVFQCGREFDFSKTFLENFRPVYEAVPRPALGVIRSTMENSDYCNQAGHLKDCYLIVNADYSERCLYGKGVNRCFDCLDCFKTYDCEACYQCCNCNNCTFSTYLFDCHSSNECHFSYNLIGCEHCFGCVNLRNQRFCLFNEQLSQAEYESTVQRLRHECVADEVLAQVNALRTTLPVKWMQERNTENCSGDYLVNCKDCEGCYDSEDLERCVHCSDIKRGSGVSFGNYEVSYYGVSVFDSCHSITIGDSANRVFFSQDIYGGNDIFYSILCNTASHDLFGCVGMKKQRYCILNKQYDQVSYNNLRAKIIAHMKETGEWGDFFPAELAPFAYNESVAIEYFPLTRERALELGYRWKEPKASEYQPGTFKPAPLPGELGDSILSELLSCETTGRNYRIQPTELEFYRKLQLPVPALCPQERHRRRMLTRNPRMLFGRRCARSGVPILTAVSPDRTEPVLCREEYEKLFR